MNMFAWAQWNMSVNFMASQAEVDHIWEDFGVWHSNVYIGVYSLILNIPTALLLRSWMEDLLLLPHFLWKKMICFSIFDTR